MKLGHHNCKSYSEHWTEGVKGVRWYGSHNSEWKKSFLGLAATLLSDISPLLLTISSVTQ